MAIYHLHAGFISRSSGRSSVQAAAYICREKLREDRRDIIADYRNRVSDVAATGTLAPESSKYKDLSVWNAAEKFEDDYADKRYKSKNTGNNYKGSAQTAQTIVMALPNELSIKVGKELVEKFINTRFTSRGLISTYALHNSEGNLHVHMQITRRAIGKDGEFENRKDRVICSRSALLETRKLWADMANEFLEREGCRERITEKSYASLGVELTATKHRGWRGDQLGEKSRIVQDNLRIFSENENRILQNPSIIIDALNATQATFSQRDMLKEIEKRIGDEKLTALVFEKVLEEAVYVGESAKGEFLYTGEKYKKLESDALSKFEELSARTTQASPNSEIASDVLEKYEHLSEEQKAAVTGLCGESNVGILLGRAGAGKTTTMRAVAEIYERSGARVIGMSISAVASENLGNDAGVESRTIASWTHSWRVYETAKEKFLSFDSVISDGVLRQLDWYNDLRRYEGSQLKAGDVIIVDEAGMAGIAEWNVILNAADKFGAKVIAVGDDNQFSPISAGRLSVTLNPAYDGKPSEKDHSAIASDVGELTQKTEGRGVTPLFELSEIRRQNVDWMREASVEFSKLNTFEALAKYANNGRVFPTDDLAFVVARGYLEIEKEGSTAVLCYKNSARREINDAIRELKKERGELGEDIVIVNGRKFAENDCVMFLENNKKFDVKNGEIATVKSFSDGILSVESPSGIKAVDVSKYDKIDASYAITLYKSQGKTFDNIIVVADKAMDAKATYVGMTRHRENVEMYYSKSEFGSFKELGGSLSKYHHKDLIADYASISNENKSRAYEYKNTLLEIASVLKDINTGQADWKEYREIKSQSLSLGKEMANDYASHKPYLDQLGITREKLEISVGLKQRPLSNVELNAKNTVEIYAKASLEARTFV